MRMLRRNAIPILAVLGLALAAGVIWSGVGERGAERTAQSLRAASPPAPLIAAQRIRPQKWEKIIEQGSYATFTTLEKVLRQGQAGPDVMAGFRQLVNDDERLERIDQWAAQLGGPERGRALLVLYAELMLTDTDPEVLLGAVDAEIKAAFQSAERDPNNYGKYFSWGLSRPVMAAVLGYEFTRDRRFLVLLAQTFDRIIPLRDIELDRVDEVRSRKMRNWGTDRYAGDGRYSAEITTAGRVAYPMIRWVEFIRTDPALQSEFGERADRYLSIAQAALAEYDAEFRTIVGTPQGYYLHVPRQKAEALNHMSWAGNALVVLSSLRDDPSALRKAEGIAEYFKASMVKDDRGCLVWQYMPQPDDRKHPALEFTWKSRTTIELPIFFASRGIIFTDADLQAISRTFLLNIQREDGRWSARIDDVFDDLENYGNTGGGLLCLTPYIQLDHVEPAVREAIEVLVATRPDAGGWLRKGHALIAYAHRLKNPGFNAGRNAELLEFPMRAPAKRPAKALATGAGDDGE